MLKSVLMAGVALAVLGGTPALAQSTIHDNYEPNRRSRHHDDDG